MGVPVPANDLTFESEVLKANLPVLVDFWATWCNPCMMIAPMIEKIAKDYKGKLKVVKVDVDVAMETASEMGIRSIPTLFIFKAGEIVEQIIGAVTEEHLKKAIHKVIGA